MKQIPTNLLRSALHIFLFGVGLTAKAQDSLTVKPYQTGKATYYSAKMHGRRMANGQAYSKHGFTCAHRSLPFGTKLKVLNKRNGKTTIVEVSDRGPFRKGLLIDISNAAAAELDMLRAGVVPVAIYVLPDSMSNNLINKNEK